MCSKRQPRRHFVIIVVALETYNDDTLGLKAHSASFNARMIYDRPVLIRSSDSGLSAFFPTLNLFFILLSFFQYQRHLNLYKS